MTADRHRRRDHTPAFAPITFYAEGLPATQGNKRVSASGHLYETSKGFKPWRKGVAVDAMIARTKRRDVSFPITAAVYVELHFQCWRPKMPARWYPRGDVEKYSRAVFDALVHGRLLQDDGQVVDHRVTKAYAPAGTPPGCRITVTYVQPPAGHGGPSHAA